MPATEIPTNIKTFITDKINEVLNKDLYNVTIEILGKRTLNDVLLHDYKFTLSEIISSLPSITFYKIDSTGGTFNIPTNEQSYMVVDSLAPSFTLEFNGINGTAFTNNYDVNDFNNCYLDITNTSLVSSNKSQVYVTDNVSFSTVNNEFFTFYYFNTGSLILGFSPASATLQAPTEIPDPADLPSLPVITPTYELRVWQSDQPVSNVNEGAQSIEFQLLTTNVTNGTMLPYTITGIDANDTSVVTLTGNLEVVIFNNNLGSAYVFLDITEDMLTEGPETMIMTLNNITPTVSAALIINDTSLTNTVTAMIGIDGQPPSPYVLVEADAQMRQDFVNLMQLNVSGDYIEPLTTSGQFILASNSLFIAESQNYGPDDVYPGPLSAMFLNASFPRDFLVLATNLSSWIFGQYVIDSNGVYVAQNMVYSDQDAFFNDPNPVGVTFTDYLTCEWIRTSFGTTNNYIDSLEIV